MNKPTFAFVTIGSGSYLGSTVRDLTLANILHRRGYKVVVYWMMEWNPELADPGIEHRLLCHGTRYQFRRPSAFMDQVVGSAAFLLPLRLRVQVTQGINGFVDRMLTHLIRSLHATPDSDAGLVRRLRHFIARDEVSHLMMSFASLGTLALAAKRQGGLDFDYVLTFQGDEQFADYARRSDLFEAYRKRLNEAVAGSRWPALLVSSDYLERIADELEVPRERMSVLYNGIELSPPSARPPRARLRQLFPGLREDLPIVTYFGRQEAEKGIDLLLYAARLLKARGVELQLVVCGATAKGESCKRVVADLAAHLGLPIHQAGAVSGEIRDTLLAHSHCVVYPSVNREAFGLVVAEAMGHGTPVLVPDYGGITEVMRDGERAGGLTFKAWDSGDLARQLEVLLANASLHRELAGNARPLAERFTAERMTDRVLQHLGVIDRQGHSPADGGMSRVA
ncbi:Glycosyl transferase, group 1 [Azotobacter vinelandii CA]|uniref:Glycosyl transferase, group 1 n=2 Tax=Azotobacter vinelandii TaxID=354 RepID=C1DM26_AZOVD|nr:glycosyltransferase family 4 protein [Azotobacter vinelandii]ACO79113.1 Glycosyl transferase, group 1 [Azotobacter vinelandii DJ]AGK16493.1 Glycosyl transferase, group 1 [Azotobacter vinelandii CA]AGK20981.1 Glycosyl transferase, group 1 [Azotobacter vinelandii CA6]WKN20089.1 glycosyltransferase family 4 protein [Azotobacter vinelandii]SFX74048.1 Glycosyltransferase involved in cell wall bisynthesis [Azotobacter vinelandii]